MSVKSNARVKMSKKAIVVILTLICVLCVECAVSAGEVIYVKEGEAGGGTSWADAYGLLQDALDDAVSSDQIWVAAGIYYPTQEIDGTGDRYKTYQLKNDVAIYGGFAGTELILEQRDWQANTTVLSGDIGVIDDASDNCYHVFYHPRYSDLNETAVLDGFDIARGHADGTSTDYRRGGGMYNRDASPTIRNCCFTDNSAGGSSYSYGGAMLNYYSSPRMINCTFVGNSCESWGGAIANTAYSSPKWVNCTFEQNFAGSQFGSYGSGGAMYNGVSCAPVLIDCDFIENTSNYDGGAMYNTGSGAAPYMTNCVFQNNSSEKQHGGAMYNKSDAAPFMVNCILSGNHAMATSRHGGAMYSFASSPVLINCTMHGNEAGCIGDGIYNYQFSHAIITNCILWSYTGDSFPDVVYNGGSSNPVVTYCNVQGGYGIPEDNNIDLEPLFADVENEKFWLQADSPCIDVGDNDSIPLDVDDLDNDGNSGELIPYDLHGRNRIVDNECNGSAIVDMGAYEYTSAYYGDFDSQCDVDLVDFAIMANAWLLDDITADIFPDPGGSGVVDVADLSILCENWLFGK